MFEQELREYHFSNIVSNHNSPSKAARHRHAVNMHSSEHRRNQ